MSAIKNPIRPIRLRRLHWFEWSVLLCLGLLCTYLFDIILGLASVNTMDELFVIFDEVNIIVESQLESQLGKDGFISIFSGKMVDSVFPDHKILEDHYEIIREEFYAVQESFAVPDMMHVEATQSSISCTYFKNDDGGMRKEYRCGVPKQWKALQLMMCEMPVPKTAKLMPKTMKLLNNCGRIVAAQVSVLMPNTVLPWHRGFHKQHLRYHLGLSVPQPDKYRMRIINNDYNRSRTEYDTYTTARSQDITEVHWKEGEGFLLDDMMLHTVENRGDTPRVVLIVDVKRSLPMFSYVLDAIVMFFVRRHELFPAFLENAEPPPLSTIPPTPPMPPESQELHALRPKNIQVESPFRRDGQADGKKPEQTYGYSKRKTH